MRPKTEAVLGLAAALVVSAAAARADFLADVQEISAVVKTQRPGLERAAAGRLGWTSDPAVGFLVSWTHEVQRAALGLARSPGTVDEGTINAVSATIQRARRTLSVYANHPSGSQGARDAAGVLRAATLSLVREAKTPRGLPSGYGYVFPAEVVDGSVALDGIVAGLPR